MSASTLKWAPMRLMMRTAGKASDGIALGFRRGFDSGEMLDYVYRNRASGRFLIGRVFDRFYLNSIGWKAIRARKQLLKRILRAEISARRAAGQTVSIADVASGPGLYLLELCRELGLKGGGVTVLCRDLDESGLRAGRAAAGEAGLAALVRYETGDACDPGALAAITPQPDIVIVSGLYELFIDPGPIRRSMAGIHSILKPGGTLVLTTQVSHPQLELIENVLVNRDGEPWRMICRPAAEAEAMAVEAGFAVRRTELEPNGLFAVTVCGKPAAAA